MTKKNPYRVALDPKIHFRSRIIFGFLTLAFFLSLGTGIYAGVKTNKINEYLVDPVKNFMVQMASEEEEPDVTGTNTVINITNVNNATTSSKTTTITPTKAPVVKQNPPVANCIRRNIREGEFASNKCYSQGDYEDLEYYLNRFNSAVFTLDGAEASMRITCSGSDFFKDSCERDKQRKSQAEVDISKYRGIIQGIIAKGR